MITRLFRRKPSPAEMELVRIQSLLDSYAVPRFNPDFPDVEMTVYGRIKWLLDNVPLAKPKNSIEAIRRLTGRIDND